MLRYNRTILLLSLCIVVVIFIYSVVNAETISSNFDEKEPMEVRLVLESNDLLRMSNALDEHNQLLRAQNRLLEEQNRILKGK